MCERCLSAIVGPGALPVAHLGLRSAGAILSLPLDRCICALVLLLLCGQCDDAYAFVK